MLVSHIFFSLAHSPFTVLNYIRSVLNQFHTKFDLYIIKQNEQEEIPNRRVSIYCSRDSPTRSYTITWCNPIYNLKCEFLITITPQNIAKIRL